jgi:hypothetical protein
MADYQITCVTMSYGGRGHEHITHVGDSSRWRDTVPNVVRFIDARTHTFYVRDVFGRRANVGVVRPVGRPPYLRTYADGYPTDNLLALNACPV